MVANRGDSQEKSSDDEYRLDSTASQEYPVLLKVTLFQKWTNWKRNLDLLGQTAYQKLNIVGNRARQIVTLPSTATTQPPSQSAEYHHIVKCDTELPCHSKRETG